MRRRRAFVAGAIIGANVAARREYRREVRRACRLGCTCYICVPCVRYTSPRFQIHFQMNSFYKIPKIIGSDWTHTATVFGTFTERTVFLCPMWDRECHTSDFCDLCSKWICSTTTTKYYDKLLSTATQKSAWSIRSTTKYTRIWPTNGTGARLSSTTTNLSKLPTTKCSFVWQWTSARASWTAWNWISALSKPTTIFKSALSTTVIQ